MKISSAFLYNLGVVTVWEVARQILSAVPS